MAPGRYYVSVTGLLTKNWLKTPKFLYHSGMAYNAAIKSKGNVYSTTFSRDGIYMTITVWESKDTMRDFFRGPAHLNAMKTMKDVSSYAKVHGYFTDEMPTADDAIHEWREEGRRVYGEARPKYGDCAETPSRTISRQTVQ